MVTMLQDPSTAGFIILTLAQTIGKVDSAILSRNKTITSSSVFGTWVPQKALDGNPRRGGNACKCCAATRPESKSWYQLDLGRYYIVYRIDVEGRAETKYSQHFQNMHIYLKSISDGIDTGVEIRITEETYNVSIVLPYPKLTRFVTLVLFNVTRIFTICELTVYGDCADGKFGNYCDYVCRCDGDPCNKTTGMCPSGRCLPGYQGASCDMYTLDEPSGNDSLLLTVSGWVFGGVTVLAAVGIFLALKIRSRRTQQKPSTTDTSLYDIPRNSRIEKDRPYDYPTVNTYEGSSIHYTTVV